MVIGFLAFLDNSVVSAGCPLGHDKETISSDGEINYVGEVCVIQFDVIVISYLFSSVWN